MNQDFDRATSTEPSSYAGAGKRRASKPDRRRGTPGSSRRFLRPPVRVLLGLGAITLAAGGALGGEPIGLTEAHAAQPTTGHAVRTAETQQQADVTNRVNQLEPVVSRSAPRREAASTLGAAAAAKQREHALRQLRTAANRRERTLQQQQAAAERRAAAAEARRRWIELNRWTLPVTSYRLTAGTFGESSYLWSTVHTGLDFAASEGSPISSVATGTVTEAGYAGSYGYRTIVTHADGTEIWYCHQSSIGVVVGESVGRGEVIGLVGSTGNVTGPHLHLEVRPGGGDPDDPYTALAARGARP